MIIEKNSRGNRSEMRWTLKLQVGVRSMHVGKLAIYFDVYKFVSYIDISIKKVE